MADDTRVRRQLIVSAMEKPARRMPKDWTTELMRSPMPIWTVLVTEVIETATEPGVPGLWTAGLVWSVLRWVPAPVSMTGLRASVSK